MKYWIETYGCQMNDHDSEVAAGILSERGLSPAGDIREAGLILLITCCVREKAEDKVYSRLGELRRLKQSNPGLLIGIAGCIPQRKAAAPALQRRFPYLDLILGTHNLQDLGRLVDQATASPESVVEVWPAPREVSEGVPRLRRSTFQAWVTISHGCNNVCSFCIVPHVRGPERSRLPEQILAEVEDLVGNGCLEVTLLGQNVNSYGRDLDPAKESLFPDLLRRVARVSGLRRLRFMTSHPKDCSLELIRVMAEYQTVCPHLHLPVQSGSDRILRKMRRGYDVARYRHLADRAREAVPGLALTTDLIVGFPGETEDDFQRTLSLVREVEFDAAFTFRYSPREGTAAARYADQVPEDQKASRLLGLNELQAAVSHRRNERLVGTLQEVLVEGPSQKDPARQVGRTRCGRTVILEGSATRAGEITVVEIASARAWTLYARTPGTPPSP
ncbi:MAG: tRNA (N6-isopentenyl adenosine(37)-C2)-methylthiotransferase MiaB [Firmicutes bacterium]|nr:tRNA (N6-isopentenyl adenosine(37)-C2)-methylthiotransferase MiaB [Bacillota bacterium]